MKLYGIGKTRWNRPYWVLQELGLDFEKVIVDPRLGEHLKPEFLSLNPHGKLPVLVDGDHVVFESAAICQYLVEKHSDAGLVPEDLKQRSVMHQWIYFAMTELETALWRIDKHTFVYPEAQRIPQDIDLAKSDFCRSAQVLEDHMKQRTYLVAERFTVGDIIVAYDLVWAGWEGFLDEFPALEAYRQRLVARPSCPPALKDEA